MKSYISKSFAVGILMFLASAAFSQVIQGTYAIKNVQTGMLLRIKDANKANGTPIVAYTPVSWKCMTWDFKHVEGAYYQLQNLFSNKTFQPVQSPAVNGSALEEQPLKENAAGQVYEFIPVSKDVYLIKLKGTDLYLTPSDGAGAVNSVITLAPRKTTPLQQWTIYEQHPEF